jgi:hypothetical protein
MIRPLVIKWLEGAEYDSSPDGGNVVLDSMKGWTDRRRSRASTLAVVTLFLLHASVSRPGKAQQTTLVNLQNSELQGDIEKLNSTLSSKDLDSLEAVVNQDSAKWQRRNRQSFVNYMSRACALLSSYDLGDQSKRSFVLSQHAIFVLTTGDLSLEENVRFVRFLTEDPLAIDTGAWRTLRKQKAQLWLEAWHRVTQSTDPKFDFDDLPLLHVPTPADTGLPSGVSPANIVDPRLRAEYEDAIARNNAKIRKYKEQYWLKRNAMRFFTEAERYLVSAYARPPADVPELGNLLSTYIADQSIRDRVLKNVQAHK